MTGLIFGVFMTEWTMVQAKRDFSAGLLRGFHFDQVPGGWSLQLQGAAGLGTGWLIDTRRRAPRVFRTLDGGVSAALEIGFRVARLVSAS